MGTIAWAIIALIIGGAVGAAAVWMFAVRRAGPLSVSEMKRENERFREEVNAHFVQSAELINELTDSYKKVFDHLSDGADRLVDSEAVRERMPQVGHAEVRLRHIGAPKDYRPSGQSSRRSGQESSTAEKSSQTDVDKDSDDGYSDEPSDDSSDDSSRKST